MAQIKSGGSQKIWSVNRWSGLNEAPDGDTALATGEAAVLENFRLTGQGHLQKRPGSKTLFRFSGPVRGLWSGWVGRQERLVCAAEGGLWVLDPEAGTREKLGNIDDEETRFFGFDKKLYFLTRNRYMVWSGVGLAVDVEGYRPLVATAAPPEGGGTLLERVNLLTGARRMRFSPDGTAKLFQLAETDVDRVDYVRLEGTELLRQETEAQESGEGGAGEASDTPRWNWDGKAGTVTLTAPPPAGTNTLEIGWTKGSGDRASVTRMQCAELYNGVVDSRVFLYGDGSHRAVYSDLTESGVPSAEYFPDLNELTVGSANTPITAMIRHYGHLLCFKQDSAYAIHYGQSTLADGSVTAAFTVVPVNRDVGCAAAGGAVLVENTPRTPYQGALYQWQAVSAGGVSTDQRNARRISDRISDTLGALDLSKVRQWYDPAHQEYYLLTGEQALVHCLKADGWCRYTGFPLTHPAEYRGHQYWGTSDGRVVHVSTRYRGDDGDAICCRYESGALSFGADWRRKYASLLWLGLKPDSGGALEVAAQTERSGKPVWRRIRVGLATFAHCNFARWSFGTSRKPQVRRVKLKQKKFAYYKLLFRLDSASDTATVVAADLRLRAGGAVK